MLSLGQPEIQIFTSIQLTIMKSFFLFLLLATFTTTASAQNTQPSDSIGTTANGLPVLRSYVPPDVVFKAIKKYGRFLYCIEKAQKENCEDSYLVGLIRNGKLTREWMCRPLKIALNNSRKKFTKLGRQAKVYGST